MTPNSSSTDSESVQNGTKRLATSASVPHQLAHGGDRLRHVRSASSVLEEMFPFGNTASESLPNLVQGPGGQRAAIVSLSTSASTSSLTSEQSGWVSSHNTSEISSPEDVVNSTQEDTLESLAMNGEQLRSRLFELINGQVAADSKVKRNGGSRAAKTEKSSKEPAEDPAADSYNMATKKLAEAGADLLGVHRNNGFTQVKFVI